MNKDGVKGETWRTKPWQIPYIKFVSDLRQVGGFLQFPSPPRYNCNNVESGVKNHKTKPSQPYEEETLLSV
jgi:hypothetical protein